MSEPPQWQFEIEVRPPDWRFPARPTWIAGWIRPASAHAITDIRARIHQRVILGLFGLPHPAFPGILPGHAHGPGLGFSFLLTPQAGATLLRLEVRDQSGRWTEFFRTKILPAPDATAPAPAPSPSQALGRLVTVLLKQRRRTFRRAWSDLADDLTVALVAEPLNAHPNPPFIGALEEPHAIGRRRNGHLPVTGWLVHPAARITRLSAVIDPLPATSLPFGLTRRDTPGVFPALSGRPGLAYAGEIALPADLLAPVLLKLFAELDNGERHLAFAQRFTPQPHGDTGQMPPLVPVWTFVRAIWALHGSAGRHALPRQGMIRAACRIWAGYRAVPVYRPKKIFALPGGFPFRLPIRPLHRNSASTRQSSDGLLPASTVISPADDMCVSDASHYFQLGREALALVQQASALAGSGRIGAILDLPCGYGRVARWFRTAYPEARLTVSDTQGAGVAFCVEQLRAAGVHAAVDGSHWGSLRGPYDIIWCGSLLTHFGRDQWVDHLRRFTERLAPRGVLVFTTHGRLALDKLQTGEKDYGLPQAEITRLGDRAAAEGFGYVDYPDTPAYGISVAQPAWILELIAQETELRVLSIREAAWDRHQDIVVCTRRPAKGTGWFRKWMLPPF